MAQRGRGFGGGRGRGMGGGRGLGRGDNCICPNCGGKIPHERGVSPALKSSAPNVVII